MDIICWFIATLIVLGEILNWTESRGLSNNLGSDRPVRSPSDITDLKEQHERD